MDLFLLKKIISALIMPLSVILILLLLGILFHKKYPRFSFKCFCAGTLLLLISSLAPFSDWVMSPIEKSYPSYAPTANKQTQNSQQVDYIIVLGCSHVNNKKLSVTDRLRNCSLQRIVEAIRIFNLHPEATIITSGGIFGQANSNAQAVKDAAVALGIPENKIITENFPKDTEEEAALISSRVKGSNVILVTNADHMKRAIKYFQKQGINPIPAPTGHWIKNNGQTSWRYFVPSSYKFHQTTYAWYESVGLFWQWLKGLFA